MSAVEGGGGADGMVGVVESPEIGFCDDEGVVAAGLAGSLVSDSESLGGVSKGTFEVGRASSQNIGACTISTFLFVGS